MNFGAARRASREPHLIQESARLVDWCGMSRPKASREALPFFEAATILYYLKQPLVGLDDLDPPLFSSPKQDLALAAPAVFLLIHSIELSLKWHIWPELFGFKGDRASGRTKFDNWLEYEECGKKRARRFDGHDLDELAEKARSSGDFKDFPKFHYILDNLKQLTTGPLKELTSDSPNGRAIKTANLKYPITSGGEERPLNRSGDIFENFSLDMNHDFTLTADEFKSLRDVAYQLLMVDIWADIERDYKAKKA
jgi:hypothetical protein